MTSSILGRLQRLEANRPGTLIAECVDVAGNVCEMPLAELEFEKWSLKRITSGNSLRDFDRYIENFKKWLVMQCEHSGTVESD